ncbi:hypothetical protein N9D23_10990 [Rubripirellula sp.]|nr:hypothetical protein [Rubripirellula sp.]
MALNLSQRLRFSIAALALASLAIAPVCRAADDGEANAIQADLFDAMDAGQVDVKFIPQSAAKANVLIKNLTDQPLELRLPEAFAGVPILGQGMMGGMGGGGGFMRVAPERVRKVAVTTVCLEHGKPDPNPKMAYKMIPLSEFTSNAEVRVVCEALGHGQITQNTAQAAAWHLMDDMSWRELAAKNRVESKYTGNIRWFSPIELQTAVAVVREASRIAERREDETSDSDSEYDTSYGS